MPNTTVIATEPLTGGEGAGVKRPALTPAEFNVLLALIQPGGCRETAAKQLVVSRRTIDTHLKSVFEKLKMRHMHHVLLWFITTYGEYPAVQEALAKIPSHATQAA